LFCDELYGGKKILKGTTFSKYKQFIENNFELLNRQALHAKSLGFVHPVNGQTLFFDSEIAPDMSKVIEKWRTYSNFKDTFAE
jgi:23S rRNA pseudouridine1911/1915/1917 synthase